MCPWKGLLKSTVYAVLENPVGWTRDLVESCHVSKHVTQLRINIFIIFRTLHIILVNAFINSVL